jgi:phage portal protein BeeE
MKEREMVFDFLRKAPVDGRFRSARPVPVGRVIAWGNRAGWPGARATPVSLTRTGFQGNPVGFRVVRLIAEAAAALPLGLPDGEQRFESHPVLDLIRRPNGAQGRAEFLEAVYGYLLLAGNAYVEAVPGLVGGAGRAACAAVGPDEPGAGRGWLAGGL